MKRIYSFLVALFALAYMPLGAFAQGWPANYGGVMLQGFYWSRFQRHAVVKPHFAGRHAVEILQPHLGTAEWLLQHNIEQHGLLPHLLVQPEECLRY